MPIKIKTLMNRLHCFLGKNKVKYKLKNFFIRSYLTELKVLIYIASHPDLIEKFGTDTIEAKKHYLETGKLEGRKLNLFKPYRYLENYADLRKAFGNNQVAATRHFIEAGYREGRNSYLTNENNYLLRKIQFLRKIKIEIKLFLKDIILTEKKALIYIASHPDLVEKLGTDTIEAKKHYIKNGKLEGRKLNLFNPRLYLENNCDLQLSLGDDEEAALKHFIKVGYFEGRTYSNNLNFSKKFNLKLNDLRLKLKLLFNNSYLTDKEALIYIASHPPLIKEFGTDIYSAKLHYINYGEPTGLPLNIFEPKLYIENNSDLKAIFGDNEEAATRHFIKNATFETGYGTRLSQKIVYIKKYSNKCDFELPISNNEDGISACPIIINKHEKPILHLKSKVSLFCFSDIITSVHTSGLLKNEGFFKRDSLLIPDHIQLNDNSDNSFITLSELFSCNTYGFYTTSINRSNAKQFVQEAILIGGPGVDNWYHFILEFLPKLFLIESKASIDQEAFILVPEICKFKNSFRDALSIFAGDRKILYLKKGEYIQCKKLYCVNEFNITPFNLPDGKWPKKEHFLLNSEVIREFSKEFRKSLNILNKKNNFPRKIFLCRDKIRREFNQDQLFEIAIKYGYQALYLEKYTLKEQAEMISNATHIIGASGAAWTSMIFANNSLKCLSWLPREYFEFATYASLAKSLGHFLLFIEYYPDKKLKGSWQVYSQSYRVDLDEFEEALKKLEIN